MLRRHDYPLPLPLGREAEREDDEKEDADPERLDAAAREAPDDERDGQHGRDDAPVPPERVGDAAVEEEEQGRREQGGADEPSADERLDPRSVDRGRVLQADGRQDLEPGRGQEAPAEDRRLPPE